MPVFLSYFTQKVQTLRTCPEIGPLLPPRPTSAFRPFSSSPFSSFFLSFSLSPCLAEPPTSPLVSRLTHVPDLVPPLFSPLRHRPRLQPQPTSPSRCRGSRTWTTSSWPPTWSSTRSSAATTATSGPRAADSRWVNCWLWGLGSGYLSRGGAQPLFSSLQVAQLPPYSASQMCS